MVYRTNEKADKIFLLYQAETRLGCCQTSLTEFS